MIVRQTHGQKCKYGILTSHTAKLPRQTDLDGSKFLCENPVYVHPGCGNTSITMIWMDIKMEFSQRNTVVQVCFSELVLLCQIQDMHIHTVPETVT